jgi:HSP20 family protein
MLGRPLMGLQEDINRLFEHLYNGTMVHTADWAKLDAMPAIDVTENGKSFKVTVELAGMAPEDVEVEVVGDSLNISGERKEEKKEEGDNYLRQEISYGSFSRAVPLPATANGEKAEATFKNGVLSVKVPKKADAVHKPKKINVKKAA